MMPMKAPAARPHPTTSHRPRSRRSGRWTARRRRSARRSRTRHARRSARPSRHRRAPSRSRRARPRPATPHGASRRRALSRSTIGPLTKERITGRSRWPASNKPAPISAEVTGMRSASNVEMRCGEHAVGAERDHEEHDVERAWRPAPLRGGRRVADGLAQARQRQRERHREQADQTVDDEHALRADSASRESRRAPSASTGPSVLTARLSPTCVPARWPSP